MHTSNRVTWINHVGVTLLCIDLRASSRDEQLAVLESYVIVLRQSTDLGLTVLVLGDADVQFSPDLVSRARAALSGHGTKIRRSALVGFEGISKLAFDGHLSSERMLGKSVIDRGKHFPAEAKAAALAWLVSD
jgi:hypothetical protein